MISGDSDEMFLVNQHPTLTVYLEKDLPHESFIGFCKCQEGVSGEGISNAILDQLTQ